MAHMETGHIHLGSSILHHTEGWETKSLKKMAATHRHTRAAISTPACAHVHKREVHRSAPQFTWYENLKNRKLTWYHSEPNKDFTDRQTDRRNTHAHTQTHDPLSSRKWWNMKWSITAWNGSLPGTVLVLCHIVFYCQKKRRGRKRGKETVNSEKQVRHFEISSFFIIYYWDFSVRKLQEISTAFDSSTCGLGIHESLSYAWALATRQTDTHVNNILDWVMTWWIMNVSPMKRPPNINSDQVKNTLMTALN